MSLEVKGDRWPLVAAGRGDRGRGAVPGWPLCTVLVGYLAGYGRVCGGRGSDPVRSGGVVAPFGGAV